MTVHDLSKELKSLKLTPQKAKGLKNSLLDLQKQIDELIKTYCKEEPEATEAAPQGGSQDSLSLPQKYKAFIILPFLR